MNGTTPAASAVSRYIARTTASARHHQQASAVVAQEIIRTAALPHPLYIASAEGAVMIDLDGNSYLDLTMGFGAHVLGHRPPEVLSAVSMQLQKGWQFGLHNAEQQPFAELLRSISPSAEKVAFSNSGTESTMYAIRAARAHTGRTRLAIFDGAYHGAHEHVCVEVDPASPLESPMARSAGSGIAPGVLQDVLMLPYLSEAALELVERNANSLALVLVQGVQNRTPHLKAGNWLRELQGVCQRNGVLFVLDEVVTGFRVALEGCRQLFDLSPDLITYGKGIGGGIPIGVTAGRADVMDRFHDRYGQGGIFSGGTFNGNPLSMVAAMATVSELQRRGPGAYDALNRHSDRLAHQVNQWCERESVPVTLNHAGSIFCLRFATGPFTASREVKAENMQAHDAFLIHLLNEGVIMPPLRMCFLSMAHGEAEVESIALAICRALAATVDDGHFAP